MAAKAKTYDHLFKLLLIGDSDCGKTQLLLRFCDPDPSTFIPTIGMDFKIKTIDINGKTVKLQIWDTAGQERFHSITTSYYRGAMGILLVYNIAEIRSFQHIQSWMDNIKAHANSDIEILLLGHNHSPDESRQVAEEDGLKLASEYNIPFLEACATTNHNVEKAFTDLALRILKKREDTSEDSGTSDTSNQLTGKESEARKCCIM